MQSNNFDGFFTFLLFGSVLLYFIFFAVMSLPFYRSDDLLGTYGHAMGDGNTYLGIVLLIGFLYLCEKISAVFILKEVNLFNLGKYQVEEERVRLSYQPLPSEADGDATKAPTAQVHQINFSGASGSSSDEPVAQLKPNEDHQPSQYEQKRTYSGFAYSEENNPNH